MRFAQALLTVTAPMLALGIWHGQPGQANNRSWVAELPPLPSLTEEVSTGDMIWVQLQDTIRLGSLAELLDLDGEQLSDLNEKSKTHLYRSGSWLKLPSASADQLTAISAVDEESLRTSPPVLVPLRSSPQPVTNRVIPSSLFWRGKVRARLSYAPLTPYLT